MRRKSNNPFLKKIFYFFLDYLVVSLGGALLWICLFLGIYFDNWTERLIYIGLTIVIMITIVVLLEKLFPSSERD